MTAAYFAIVVIIAVLIIYWGSAEPEPPALAKLFGPRRPGEKPATPSNRKRRW